MKGKRQMKVRVAVVLMTVTMIVIITSCGLLDDDGNKPKELIPLKVGNYWDYHRWYISPNIADTIREGILDEYKILIEGDSIIIYGYKHFYNGANTSSDKGKTDLWQRAVKKVPGMYKGNITEPEYQWLRAKAEEGLVSFGGISPTDTLILKAMQYKYPGKTGDETEYPTLSYSFQELEFSVQDTITIETMGTNETFESDIATYRGCYVYRFSEKSTGDALYWWDHFVYIKPSIGVVAVTTKDKNVSYDRIIGQWVLINYKIK